MTHLPRILYVTHPIIFPRPYESVFFGMRLFKRGDWKTFARNGNALTNIITGMVLSVVSMYAKTSSSFSMKPNGFPNAISPIKSKVRYWAFRAKSTGLYSEAVEIYLVAMSLIRLAITLSIDSSRSGFSFPAYCKKVSKGAHKPSTAGILQEPFSPGGPDVSRHFVQKECWHGLGRF